MNRRITFYYTFLLIIATMFTALGNYQNIYATSTFSGLYDGTLNSNLNGTLNTLTPFNDEVNNTESNNLQDCANCIGNDGIDQGISAPIISNDNPNENDVSGDSPFSLPFNTQFADPSDDADGDISDKIPFP